MGRIGKIEVTDRHVGSTVMYFPDHPKNHFFHPDVKLGVIQSYDKSGVFVRFVNEKFIVPYDSLIWYYGSNGSND